MSQEQILRDKLEKTQNALEQMVDEVLYFERKVESLRDENKSLHQQVNDSSYRMEDQTKIILTLNREISVQKQFQNTLQLNFEVMEKEKNALAHENQELRTELRRLKSSLTDTNSQTGDVQRQLDFERAETENLRIQTEEIVGQLNKALKENAAMKMNHSEAKNELKKRKSEVDTLNLYVKELQKELFELKQMSMSQTQKIRELKISETTYKLKDKYNKEKEQQRFENFLFFFFLFHQICSKSSTESEILKMLCL